MGTDQLSGPQRRLLKALADGKECPVRSNTYRTARVLFERGLVQIEPGPFNRMASITDAGRDVLRAGGKDQ